MSPQLLERIGACTDLPSLPAIAVQVLEMAQAENADLNQIAAVITRDPALSGKILRTVNSSFYGRARNVATISQAMVVLGLQSVKTLVLGFSLVTGVAANKARSFDHKRYWRHSLFTAAAARQIAQKLAVVQIEEVFLVGLLADIGMMVMDRVLGESYGPVAAAVSHHDLVAAEAAAFGSTHAEFSGHLAGTWKLPPLLAVPITYHHDAASVEDPQLRRLADIVGMASRCADLFTDADPAAAVADVRGCWFQKFGLSVAAGDDMMSQIQEKAKEIATLFDIPLGESETYEVVLRRASDALVALMLQTQRQNETLRVQATTDPLTGLANRADFEQRSALFWKAAMTAGKPLSVIMIDLDRFKSVNDSYGHPAGDEVLRGVGRLIAKAVRAGDVAARFGGEEMILALPNTTRATATALAELLRTSIKANVIMLAGVRLTVTASFGVASFECDSPLKSLAYLIKAADLALYQAKNAGRDRVKVFQPNVAKAA